MYDDLIKAIRQNKCHFDSCGMCPKRNALCLDRIALQAADAVEELQEDNAALNGTVSNLLEQIAELSKPRWIPVKERMPVGGDDSGAVCENVCLLMDDGTVSCGWMNGITKKVYYLNARDDVVIKAPITRVTHWMPLPQPPKEDE